LKEVAAVTDLLFIFLFIQLHLALIALRKKLPDVPRSFRVPLYPLPSLVALFAYGLLVYQFFHVSPIGLVITLFWILSGLLIYYAYSKPVEIEKIEKGIIFEEKFRVSLKKKHRILLPIRPDSNWRDILALAISIAKEKDAEICILHIKEIPYPLPLQVKEEELQADKEFLEEALSLSIASKVSSDALFMISRSISRAIKEIIQKESPDLLVLGWKGYTKMTATKPKIFGRELDKILREANCDLIVARINHLDDLKNILLPCAGDPHTHFVGEVAGIIAKAFGSKIRVVFVSEKNGAKKFDPEEKLKEILSLLNIPSHIPLKSEVIYVEHYSPRAVAYQIVQKSQDFGSVLMASARGGIFREMIFGNIPEIVARNSSSTLILVKHHQTIIEPFFSYIRSRF
jgi:CIC family chloride channel protein